MESFATIVNGFAKLFILYACGGPHCPSALHYLRFWFCIMKMLFKLNHSEKNLSKEECKSSWSYIYQAILNNAQKMNFSIKNSFSKYRRKIFFLQCELNNISINFSKYPKIFLIFRIFHVSLSQLYPPKGVLYPVKSLALPPPWCILYNLTQPGLDEESLIFLWEVP